MSGAALNALIVLVLELVLVLDVFERYGPKALLCCPMKRRLREPSGCIPGSKKLEDEDEDEFEDNLENLSLVLDCAGCKADLTFCGQFH